MFVATCPLVLASSSPRRQELLRALGLSFVCDPAEIDETPRKEEQVPDYAMRMARTKAEYVAGRHRSNECIIAADTVVAIDGRILGKPGDHHEALAFLQLLNGRAHTVISAFCVKAAALEVDEVELVQSRVQFGQFEDNVLAAYAASTEPLDKAGAYAIQGTGCFLVSALSGSGTNVIGLPVEELVQVLLRHQVIVPVADMAVLSA